MCKLLQVHVPEAHGRIQNLPRTRIIAHQLLRSLKRLSCLALQVLRDLLGRSHALAVLGERGAQAGEGLETSEAEPSLEDAQRVSKLA